MPTRPTATTIDDGPDRGPDRRAIEALDGVYERPWGESTVDFTPPWPRKTYFDLFREHAGVDPRDPDAVKAKAESLKIATAGKDADVILSEVFEATVEDALPGRSS